MITCLQTGSANDNAHTEETNHTPAVAGIVTMKTHEASPPPRRQHPTNDTHHTKRRAHTASSYCLNHPPHEPPPPLGNEPRPAKQMRMKPANDDQARDTHQTKPRNGDPRCKTVEPQDDHTPAEAGFIYPTPKTKPENDRHDARPQKPGMNPTPAEVGWYLLSPQSRPATPPPNTHPPNKTCEPPR
ncbi:hypothetical protein BS47DRAFT_1369823 [Hydnum rufescens UP504]|uniref:Uncharacterized protein n=1 Tax=Hydnum rufescens UP504 TaxID=1448309 RepID=A0A9P6ADP5_9AGAM|nr:hypothetical protein BS47DRAFT_1369823 [Hydnum rufescens UP504]